MNKLEILIKQQTPMIHFQYEQVGATLRATEVKPKLDKWILEKKGKSVPAEWKIKGTEALNYKLKILPTGIQEDPLETGRNTPMYFADMGGNANSKRQTFNSHPLKLVFIVPNEGLKDEIKRQIAAFFFHENFGTRQNKGYGAFLVLDDERQPILLDSEFKFSFARRENDPDEFLRLFTVIQYYYQRLKSGINYKKGSYYRKSFLSEYVRENLGYYWEKRWLKKNLTDIPVPEEQRVECFARAMLGLPYEFRFMDRRPPGAAVHGPLPSRSTNIKVEADRHEIKRIKSPITFKPVILDREIIVYVHFMDLTNEQQITNQPYLFSNGRQNRRLYTPSKVIEIKSLLRAYHQHLENSFTAFDFTGKYETKVTIL
jgi:hypothetical protein